MSERVNLYRAMLAARGAIPPFAEGEGEIPRQRHFYAA